MAGQALRRLCERERATFPYPVAKEVQAEAGVVEEGEVRPGVGKRHQDRRMARHPPDVLLFGVQQQGAEHRAQAFLEREVEHVVERVGAGYMLDLALEEG